MTAHEPCRSDPLAAAGGPYLVTDSYRARRGVVVVTVAGEVDLATEPGLRAALAAATAEPDICLVVCDMSDVSYISCGGLSVLIEAGLVLDRRAATLRVVAWRPMVLRLVELSGLTEALDLHRDVTEACAPPL